MYTLEEVNSVASFMTAYEESFCLLLFNKCQETIVSALNDYCTRWCKRGHVEANALKNWTVKIFKINVCYFTLIRSLDLLSPKPKLSFRYLKRGIQEFHRQLCFGSS